MSLSQPHPFRSHSLRSTETETATDQRTQDHEYCRRVLLGLIGMGNDVATLVHRQILSTAEATEPVSDPGPDNSAQKPGATAAPAANEKAIALFDLAARTVRRTVLLLHKLNQPAQQRNAAANDHPTNPHNRVIRAIQDNFPLPLEGDGAEYLQADYLDRLDQPDITENIAALPDDILQEIIRDFTVAHVAAAHLANRRASTAASAANATPTEPPATSAPPPSGFTRPNLPASRFDEVARRPGQPAAGVSGTGPPPEG
jgi:hypothetical protein